MATSSRAYSDAVGQFEAYLVVGYGGDDVAVASVFNGFGQLDGVRRAVVSSNLEAVFFQVVQLAAINGFFAVGSNRAVCYVIQSHRSACVAAHQFHLVARSAGGSSCGVNVGHRGVELNLGDAASARDFGYGALAVGKVDGVAVGDKVFVNSVALYGEASIQYVVDGGGVVAFAVGGQGRAVVIGRVGRSSSGISQVALDVGQGGGRRSVARCILHARNDVARLYLLCPRLTFGLVVEVAVAVFVDLAAVSFGIHDRGLRTLHHRLGVQGVGVALVAVGVQVLFHGQSVTSRKGYFLTRFDGGGSGSSASCQVAARSGLEAAVVDGVGNVASRGQFVRITSSRRGYFAVGNCQRRGVSRYFIGGAAVGICRIGNGDAVTSSDLVGGRFELTHIHCVGIGRTGRHVGDAAVENFPHPSRVIAANRYFAQLYARACNAGNIGICRRFVGRCIQIRFARDGEGPECHAEVGVVFNFRAVTQGDVVVQAHGQARNHGGAIAGIGAATHCHTAVVRCSSRANGNAARRAFAAYCGARANSQRQITLCFGFVADGNRAARRIGRRIFYFRLITNGHGVALCRFGLDASGQCVRSRSTVVVVVAARSLFAAVDAVVVRLGCTTHRLQLGNVYCIGIFLTCSHPRDLTSDVICNIAYRNCRCGRSPSSVILCCNCIQRVSSFHTSSSRSN